MQRRISVLYLLLYSALKDTIMEIRSTKKEKYKLGLVGVGMVAISLGTLLTPAVSFAQVSIPDGDVAGLITAINTANANPGPDIINLAPGGTYTLTVVNNGAPGPGINDGSTGLPAITSQITINGNGATIQRSSAAGIADFRIFRITSPGDLTLDGVTIRGGKGFNGGGLLIDIGATLRLMNSTVTENGGAEGGGIFNFRGTLAIVNSTISHNTGFGGRTGGGILTFQVAAASTTIVNSTIFENVADGPPGFQGRGDAIADGFSAPGSIVIKNSILASPTNGLGNDFYVAAGVVTSMGHNIVSDASAGLTGTGDMNSTNPLLGPLANNGGPTLTHAPLLGSPAIDAVPLADCIIATDQRGVARPQGTACDIGSVEFSPPCVLNWSVPNGTLRFSATQASGLQLSAFNGALGYESPRSYFGNGAMIVQPSECKPVLLKLATVNFTGNYEPIFNPGDPNMSYGYRYLRAASAAPAHPQFAPYIINPTGGYAYQEFSINVPLSAWDVSDPLNPQRLAVGFLENNAANGLVDGKYWPGSDQLFDNTAANGPREWLFIFDEPYSTISNSNYTSDILAGATHRVMYMVTWNRIHQAPFSPSTSGQDEFLITPSPVTSVVQNNELPTSFALEQNYPNPFNPTTTIEYHVPIASFVKLSVFDILGREITVLVNANVQAGKHRLTFDASSFAAGVYLYRMDAGKFQETRKLILLK